MIDRVLDIPLEKSKLFTKFLILLIFNFQRNYVYVTFQLINKSDNGNHCGDCSYSCDRSVGDIHWSYRKFAEETRY